MSPDLLLEASLSPSMRRAGQGLRNGASEWRFEVLWMLLFKKKIPNSFSRHCLCLRPVKNKHLLKWLVQESAPHSNPHGKSSSHKKGIYDGIYSPLCHKSCSFPHREEVVPNMADFALIIRPHGN